MQSPSKTTSLLQTHVSSIFLSVASSMDIFAAELSNGSSGPRQNPLGDRLFRANFMAAVSHATRTFFAMLCGGTLRKLPGLALKKLAAVVSSSSSPEIYVVNFSVESLLASFAFAYLAWKEISEKGDIVIVGKEVASPMTINHLTSGVAAGMMGIPIIEGTIYSFFVSFLSKYFGHSLARRAKEEHSSTYNSSQLRDIAMRGYKYVPILIYALFSLQSFLKV